MDILKKEKEKRVEERLFADFSTPSHFPFAAGRFFFNAFVWTLIYYLEMYVLLH